MHGTESVQFSDIAATPASFALKGGHYSFSMVATTGESPAATINQLGPDGSTYLATSLTLAASGIIQGFLPPGLYQLELTGLTAVYANVCLIPED
jgi:hypothetical protein